MKKFYNKLIKFLKNIPVWVEKKKTKFFENKSIRKKKKLYKCVKWDKQKQKSFDAYWKENYGKKISNKWHRLYEKANGIYNIEYFPEILFSTKLELLLNNYTQISVIADKNFNDILFNNRIENVRTPETYIYNSFGKFYDGERNLISRDKAIEILKLKKTAVIKPTKDSSSGKNVLILELDNGVNLKTEESVEQILSNYKRDYIVQEKIVPHCELRNIYSKSINTIRVITYVLDNQIYTSPLTLRFGSNGGEIDNIHAGGMSIAVEDDGKLSKYAYRLGYGDNFEKFDKHPNTNITFFGYKLSFINQIVSSAKKLHFYTLGVGMISWDFTVNDKNEVIIIEANYKGQSAWFPQMLSGKALFGENTKQILQLLRNK